MKKVLVTYFSVSGITREVAERLAKEIGADLFEIQAQTPYTRADLDWKNHQSRSTIEMTDKSCRPAIGRGVEEMAQYEVVFIGYPIWWGEAPRIVSTFVENHDFSGKTVIPFCTSGGSGVEMSERNLREQAGSGNWLKGQRFSAGVSRQELQGWLNGLQEKR